MRHNTMSQLNTSRPLSSCRRVAPNHLQLLALPVPRVSSLYSMHLYALDAMPIDLFLQLLSNESLKTNPRMRTTAAKTPMATSTPNTSSTRSPLLAPPDALLLHLRLSRRLVVIASALVSSPQRVLALPFLMAPPWASTRFVVLLTQMHSLSMMPL